MQRVLILGKVWPEPGSSAAGSRTLQLMDVFKKHGCEIVFASPATTNENSASLTVYNANTKQVNINDSAFDDWLKQIKPDMVMFDRFTTEEQFGWRVHAFCPEALKLLDTIDLHCLRLARHQALKENREMQTSDLLESDVALRELASIYRCDISVMISLEEMKLLTQVFKVPEDILHYTPFLPESSEQRKRLQIPRYEERDYFISIGNFLHAPNWDAVLQLKTKIWPLIRQQIPDAKLHIYGAYASEKVYELNAPAQGFLVMGRAENAMQVMLNARVCLAPLRFGAGMKGKLLEAMIAHTPSVTTWVGAEAMYGNHEWAGAICSGDESFVDMAVKLFNEKKTWEEAVQNGLKILTDIFDTPKHTLLLIDKIKTVSQNLKAHRLGNFTGAMLKHQNNAATKYMAMWIEEKNKIKNP